MTAVTTKRCPQCGSVDLIQLTSLKKKLCPDCRAEIPWTLDPGQQPLLQKIRIKPIPPELCQNAPNPQPDLRPMTENPSYYDAGGIKTIDVIRAKLTPEQYRGFLLGNIIKYALRLNYKYSHDTSIDGEKLAQYSQWLAELDQNTAPTEPPQFP